MRDFAYLANGKIHVKIGDSPERIVESRFGQSVRQRAIEVQRRNAWKTQGRGAQFMQGGALWGVQPKDGAPIPIQVCAIARGCGDGELLYSLETAEVSGLFALKEYGNDETRILHTSDFRVREVSRNDQCDKLACVFAYPNGNSTIAVMRPDGSEINEVTQGDIIDMAPRWVPGSTSQILYQSAGIGRNAQGVAVCRGPFSVQRIDLEHGEVTTLVEEQKADLLCPQMSPAGAVCYIRRPYAHPDTRLNPWRLVLDIVLFPFRLLYAVFQYLNFFTATYTGKFLTSSGGAQQREANVGRMMIWGNMVDAAKAARERHGEEYPALVPASWELVRKELNAKEQVLAKAVLSFDLCADGSILYSNGGSIFLLTPDGRKERLATGSLIQQVVTL